MKLLVENQPKVPEEQLLGRRVRVLSALGMGSVDLVSSDHSEGVLRTGHNSDFDRVDYGDDCSPVRCHGPPLVVARRLLREARDESDCSVCSPSDGVASTRASRG